MLISEYYNGERAALIKKEGVYGYTVSFFLKDRLVQKMNTSELTDAEKLAENYTNNGGSEPALLME